MPLVGSILSLVFRFLRSVQGKQQSFCTHTPEPEAHLYIQSGSDGDVLLFIFINTFSNLHLLLSYTYSLSIGAKKQLFNMY